MRQNVTKVSSTPYNLVLEATINPVTLGREIFQSYVCFRPNKEQDNGNPNLVLTNNNPNAQIIGTIPLQEKQYWHGLYAKCKLSKVIVKYTPAITQGMATSTGLELQQMENLRLSTNAMMMTTPCYDNIDNVIDDDNFVKGAPAWVTYNDWCSKPYTRQHSIYKPWTRVLKPTQYMKDTSYDNNETSYHKQGSRWVDTDTNVTMHGIKFMCPALLPAGLLPTGTTLQTQPNVLHAFLMGKVQFIYYMKYKQRI